MMDIDKKISILNCIVSIIFTFPLFKAHQKKIVSIIFILKKEIIIAKYGISENILENVIENFSKLPKKSINRTHSKLLLSFLKGQNYS